MIAPRSSYVRTAGHEVHVTEWGEPSRPALLMWHGLARTGRDFDEAAEALCGAYFVLCPDTIGRGLSSWAGDPYVDYSYSAYGRTALALLDHYRIDRLRWVGTSMGGLVGVTLAGGRLQGRISHLVVNDIGPDLSSGGVARIAAYVGSPPVFDAIAELESWLRQNYAPFGPNTDAFWRRMADTSARRTDAGRVTVHYDPRIVAQLTHQPSDRDLWPAWDAISARTLLIRGESSDMLSQDLAAEMAGRGPKPRLHTVRGCGHAPTLAAPDQLQVLRDFLAS